MNKYSKNRIRWIDVAKGLGIFYVVTGHVFFNDDVKSWLVSFHMPLFLFLSGYLFNYKKIKQLLISKTKTMIGPYCFFSVISIIYYWLIECRFRNLSYTVCQSIVGGILCYIPYMNNAPIWYLPCAFIIIILYDWIRIKIGSTNTLLLGMVLNCLYWISGCQELLYQFPYELPRILDLFVYYCIGVVIGENRDYIENLFSKRDGTKGKMQLVGICIILYGVGFYLSQLELYVYPIMSIVMAFIGIIGTLCISFAINNGFLCNVGKSSLFILCTHSFLYRLIIGIVSKITHLSSNIIRGNILYAFVIIIVTILVCMELERIYNSIKGKTIHICGGG